MKKYDVLIVVFNNLNYDARAYNLANTLVNLGLSVLVISFKSNSKQNYKFENIEVEINQNKRVFFQWVEFYQKVKQVIKNIKCKFFVGSDLYSLAHIKKIDKECLKIYDSREIYSALAALKNRKFSQLIITFLEKHLLKKVDKIMVSGEFDRDYLIQKKGFQKDFYVIKNLPPRVKIENSNYLREKYSICKDYKIVIYQGAIISDRGLFPFLDIMKEIENIFFVMIGVNEIEKELIEKIIKNGLNDRCKIHQPVNYTKLFEITKSADFGISLFEPVSDSYKYALPNKIFEYLSCGIPYIATNLPAINLLTNESKAGILVNNVYNQIELEEKILELMKNYQKLKKNAEHKMKDYTYESQIDEIKRLINYV